MDDQTFTGASGGWARDNAEVEVVLGVKGITGQKLRSLLLATNSEGRTLYEPVKLLDDGLDALRYAAYSLRLPRSPGVVLGVVEW